jgi:hypothetical protein
MKHSLGGLMALVLICALSACGGDKNDSTDRQNEAQKAIQEGMQKEKAMYEGMQKGVENVQKKAEETTKK